MRHVCVWLGVVLALLTAESGVHSSQAVGDTKQGVVKLG